MTTQATVAPRPLDTQAAPAGRASPAPKQRDPFLDVIRGIATVRVVLWHMYGFAVLSYMFAAIPAMFFVSGSLFGSSLLRRPLKTVVLDRFRRVLIPLWLFAAGAWVLMMWVAGSNGVGIPWTRIAPWVFPLVDPHGLGVMGEWLASPLWFLRMLTWILLLSPLILRALDRWGSRVLVAGPIAVLACDWAARRSSLQLDAVPRLWWVAGEFALYGTFFTLGLVHCRTGFRAITTRRWWLLACTFAALAVAWRLTQPVPDGIVNNSQPLHLLVGATWLSVAFACRAAITRFARRPGPSQVVGALSRRSFTIYLWHTLVIFAVLDFLEDHGSAVSWVNDIVYPVLVVMGLAAVTAMVGWVEDLAARRPPAITPVPVPSRTLTFVGIGTAGIVIAVVVALAFAPWNAQAAHQQTAAAVYVPRLPSQQPPPPQFVPEEIASAMPTATVPPASESASSTLHRIVTTFQDAEEVPGLVVGVRSFTSGFQWSTALGSSLEGVPMTVHDRLDISSASKVWTATLVMQQVDQGTIDLDAPLPWLADVPDFPYNDMLTPRMLLEHRSGLVDYRATDQWAEDPTSIVSAADAVRASGEMGLLFQPGDEVSYASVNYLVLGLLLEQVTGRTYDDLLSNELLVPLGLTETVHVASGPSEPRAGAAGIQAPVSDLLTAAERLLQQHPTVSDAAFATMTDFDVQTGLGAGVAGYCPCTVSPDGTHHFFAIGMTGGSTFFAFVPSLDVAVVVQVGDDLWTRTTRIGAAVELVHQLAITTATAH
ncbi:MAG: serine hydrolase [Acidimicrobiia bacterium]